MMHPKVSVTKREDGKRSIVLWMHRPHLTFAAYEILYDGTGEFQTLKLGYRNLSGELQNPSEFVRNRAPHRSAEELRETMDLLRKRQKEMSKAPADTTRGSSGRIDGGDELFQRQG